VLVSRSRDRGICSPPLPIQHFAFIHHRPECLDSEPRQTRSTLRGNLFADHKSHSRSGDRRGGVPDSAVSVFSFFPNETLRAPVLLAGGSPMKLVIERFPSPLPPGRRGRRVIIKVVIQHAIHQRPGQSPAMSDSTEPSIPTSSVLRDTTQHYHGRREPTVIHKVQLHLAESLRK
jgi:hypothetical protein